MRRKERLFLLIMLVADVMALSASFRIAYWIRSRFLSSAYGSVPEFSTYAWAIWVVAPSFVLAMASFKLYQSATYRTRRGIVRLTLESVVLGTLIVLGALYMMKQFDMSRLVLNILAMLCALVLPAEKLAMKEILDRTGKYRRKRQRWQVLIIGEHDEADAYLRLLGEHPHWGVTVAGIVSPAQIVRGAAAASARGSAGYAIVTSVDWRELLKGYVVDEIVAVSEWSRTSLFGDLQEACSERGLIFRMLVTMPPPPFGRYDVDNVGSGSYLVSLETVPQNFLPLMAKRAIDVAGSMAGLAACGLVYACYAPILWWQSPGPVFFKQKRGGHNGRIFTVYKFRTMHVDAEQHLTEVLSRNRVNGVMFKMENDPRIVGCGRFMRRTHLDELPQFWNVLKGDMSIVGPRPNPAREVAHYGYRHHRRLSMKPGITGLFQINGHSAVPDFEKVVELDCAYIDQWSIWLDCKIIARTIVKMTRADGW